MDKLELTGRDLGLVFNNMQEMHVFCHEAKQPNFKLKT